MKLSAQQIGTIIQFVDSQVMNLPLLRDDLIDHLCCTIENDLTVSQDKDFEQAFQEALKEIAPQGLKDMERKTIYLLHSTPKIMMKKFMFLIGFLGSLSITGGITFKLLHWPGGNELFIVGYLTLLLVFVPLYILNQYSLNLNHALAERLKLILGGSSSVILGLAGLFKIWHLQGATWMLLSGAVIFAVGFLPVYFFTLYKKTVASN